MASTVVGFFDSYEEAQNAVEQLVNKSFDRSSIDVSSGNDASLSTSDTANDNDGQEKESGISRFFKNLFGSNDDEADRYSKVGSKMGAIVTVHAQSDDEAEKAADLLDDYGAVDVDEKAVEHGYSSKGASFGNMDAGADYTIQPGITDVDRTSAATTGFAGTTAATATNEGQNSVIPVIQEDLEVGKKTVQTGGVRVRSRIVERPVEESIRLRQEQVRVERTPVNRVLADTDLASFEEKNIELIETAEVPVVSKQARVIEEVRVSKDAIEQEETIRDTVRSTEIEVEDLASEKNIAGNNNLNTTSSRTL